MNQRTAKLLNAVGRKYGIDARGLRKDWARLSARRKAHLRRKFARSVEAGATRLYLGGRGFVAATVVKR